MAKLIAFANEEYSGTLEELLNGQVPPIYVENALLELKENFNADNLFKYFNAIDKWEEEDNSEYVGDTFELLKVSENGDISVKFIDSLDNTETVSIYSLIDDDEADRYLYS